ANDPTRILLTSLLSIFRSPSIFFIRTRTTVKPEASYVNYHNIQNGLLCKQFAILTCRGVFSTIGGVIDVSPDQTAKAQREQFYRAVGAKLRRLRCERGWKQETLAHAVGLARTSLTNIEKGRQGLLLHVFAALLSALNAKPE